MQAAEREVVQVFEAFYDALDDLLQAKGIQKMADIWHHVPEAATSHPFGGWARGWEEVWTNWQEGAAVFVPYEGHAGRGQPIGGIHDLKVTVSGDIAIATSIYTSKLFMSDGEIDLRLNCTNIARRIDGVWKIIHHHADQAQPDWQARIGRMVEQGRS